MNALLELLVLSGISFLIFMYLGYQDAIRSKAPSGVLASLFNNLSFWKAEDDKGIRGYLYRQNIILKVVVAFVGTMVIRLIYAYFFDFGSASNLFSIFTGYSGFLIHTLVVLAAILLSYQWPKVKNKMIAIKDEAIKDEDEKAKELESKVEVPKLEKKEGLKENAPEIKPEEPKAETKPDPKKDDPNDIINEYLK